MDWEDFLYNFKRSKICTEYLENADEEELIRMLDAINQRILDLQVIDLSKLGISEEHYREFDEIEEYMEGYDMDSATPYIITPAAREQMSTSVYATHVIALDKLVKSSKTMEYLGFTTDGWDLHEYYISDERFVALVYNCYKSENKILIGGYGADKLPEGIDVS